MPNFLEQDGMIQFILSRNKLRFEVNLVAAHKCGFAVGSQMLKVTMKGIGKLSVEAPR